MLLHVEEVLSILSIPWESGKTWTSKLVIKGAVFLIFCMQEYMNLSDKSPVEEERENSLLQQGNLSVLISSYPYLLIYICSITGIFALELMQCRTVDFVEVGDKIELEFG